MEDYLQTEFPELRAWLTSVTEQWAVIAIQGPRAAQLLAPFISGIDLASMPHMSVRDGRLGDVPDPPFPRQLHRRVRFRNNLPPDHAQRVWDTLLQGGATPYGTDAMHILRAEKGYIVIGQETDGTVIPDDLGFGRMIDPVKGDFVGKRSLARPDMQRMDRKQLVGLLPTDPSLVLPEGAQVTEQGHHPALGPCHLILHQPCSWARLRPGAGFRRSCPHRRDAAGAGDAWDRGGDRCEAGLLRPRR